MPVLRSTSYCLIILAATDGMAWLVFSTQWKHFRLDKKISTRGKKSRLVVRIRLEEIILDSTKIVSTRDKNYRLDDKILDSMKKFSTRKKKYSRLEKKILDSRKKFSSWKKISTRPLLSIMACHKGQRPTWWFLTTIAVLSRNCYMSRMQLLWLCLYL